MSDMNLDNITSAAYLYISKYYRKKKHILYVGLVFDGPTCVNADTTSFVANNSE